MHRATKIYGCIDTVTRCCNQRILCHWQACKRQSQFDRLARSRSIYCSCSTSIQLDPVQRCVRGLNLLHQQSDRIIHQDASSDCGADHDASRATALSLVINQHWRIPASLQCSPPELVTDNVTLQTWPPHDSTPLIFTSRRRPHARDAPPPCLRRSQRRPSPLAQRQAAESPAAPPAPRERARARCAPPAPPTAAPAPP